MGDVEYAKMHDFWFPPEYLRLFDGPATTISHMWRVLGRPHVDGGFVVGTIVKPKLGLRPQPFADACLEFIKNDEPQGNQVFAPMKETIPRVVDAMKRAQDETGEAKLFSANITADDPFEMIARGEYILETFAELADHVAFLVDGYVAGPTAITTARRRFPSQYLHYHRAGHGAVTSPQTQRGYTAFVHCKMARIQGSSGIHTGTMSFGKMEGEQADRAIAYMLERDSADGPYFHQEWAGMNPTTPIISGGMNALRIPGFFENLGHSNVVMSLHAHSRASRVTRTGCIQAGDRSSPRAPRKKLRATWGESRYKIGRTWQRCPQVRCVSAIAIALPGSPLITTRL